MNSKLLGRKTEKHEIQMLSCDRELKADEYWMSACRDLVVAGKASTSYVQGCEQGQANSVKARVKGVQSQGRQCNQSFA